MIGPQPLNIGLETQQQQMNPLPYKLNHQSNSKRLVAIEKRRVMWAALSTEPLKLRRRSAISSTTSTKPSPRRRSVVVRNTQGGEEMGGAVVNEPVRHLVAVKSKSRAVEKKEAERRLSGSDILTALHRATAHKSVKEYKQKSQISDGRRENEGAFCFSYYSKPLCIKPEWSDRLHELESRLKELDLHG